jgi:hypothetical protein
MLKAESLRICFHAAWHSYVDYLFNLYTYKAFNLMLSAFCFQLFYNLFKVLNFTDCLSDTSSNWPVFKLIFNLPPGNL